MSFFSAREIILYQMQQRSGHKCSYQCHNNQITKIEGSNTPFHKSILRATNSINPRVFISVPIVRLFFHDSPTRREAIAQPPSLPAIATAINRIHTPQNRTINQTDFRTQTCKCKNKGKKRPMQYLPPFPSSPYGTHIGRHNHRLP